MLHQFFTVRQTFERERVADAALATKQALASLQLQHRIKPGDTVAITAGSRGIQHLFEITKAVVDGVKQLGATPFIVPAMGSHGGATGEGQAKLIAGYGLTPERLGCEVRSSMGTIELDRVTVHGATLPLHFDKQASGADHVLVINRVKPHTDFSGEIESGLAKMALIGLGKHAGAKLYHRAALDFDFQDVIHAAVDTVIAKGKIAGFIGVIENAYDETARIVGVPPTDVLREEPKLLEQARVWLPRLPFREAHLLIVDEMGKNLSGTGMDTNVVGRKHYAEVAAADEWPKVRRIYVRSLTKETDGNALGIGIAEFCHRRVIDAMSLHKTRTNALTSGRISMAMLPFDFPNDRDALNAALPTIGLAEPNEARIQWIKNTLDVELVRCSAAYWEGAATRTDLEVVRPLEEVTFGDDGELGD